MKFYFLRHFKTKVDPTTPATEWDLSDDGISAMKNYLETLITPEYSKIYTSPEKKALVTAKAISSEFNISYEITDLLREIDRGKSGFIESNYRDLVKIYFENNLLAENKWEPKKKLKQRIHIFLDELV